MLQHIAGAPSFRVFCLLRKGERQAASTDPNSRVRLADRPKTEASVYARRDSALAVSGSNRRPKEGGKDGPRLKMSEEAHAVR